jgi:hypothetical protein
MITIKSNTKKHSLTLPAMRQIANRVYAKQSGLITVVCQLAVTGGRDDWDVDPETGDRSLEKTDYTLSIVNIGMLAGDDETEALRLLRAANAHSTRQTTLPGLDGLMGLAGNGGITSVELSANGETVRLGPGEPAETPDARRWRLHHAGLCADCGAAPLDPQGPYGGSLCPACSGNGPMCEEHGSFDFAVEGGWRCFECDNPEFYTDEDWEDEDEPDWINAGEPLEEPAETIVVKPEDTQIVSGEPLVIGEQPTKPFMGRR